MSPGKTYHRSRTRILKSGLQGFVMPTFTLVYKISMLIKGQHTKDKRSLPDEQFPNMFYSYHHGSLWPAKIMSSTIHSDIFTKCPQQKSNWPAPDPHHLPASCSWCGFSGSPGDQLHRGYQCPPHGQIGLSHTFILFCRVPTDFPWQNSRIFQGLFQDQIWFFMTLMCYKLKHFCSQVTKK